MNHQKVIQFVNYEEEEMDSVSMLMKLFYLGKNHEGRMKNFVYSLEKEEFSIILELDSPHNSLVDINL